MVLSYFLSKLLIEELLSPGQFVLFALALIAIIALRGPFSFVQGIVRTGLSIIGIIIFFANIYYSAGIGVALAFGMLFGLLLIVYFYIRGFGRLFGRK